MGKIFIGSFNCLWRNYEIPVHPLTIIMIQFSPAPNAYRLRETKMLELKTAGKMTISVTGPKC